MTIEAVLFNALKSLVANRVYPLEFPQVDGGTPVWPAIRYTFISQIPVLDICGDNDEPTDEVHVQLDIVAETYAGMKTLSRSVRFVMASFNPPATLEGGSEQFDAETRTRRAQFDYIFHGSSESGNSP